VCVCSLITLEREERLLPNFQVSARNHKNDFRHKRLGGVMDRGQIIGIFCFLLHRPALHGRC